MKAIAIFLALSLPLLAQVPAPSSQQAPGGNSPGTFPTSLTPACTSAGGQIAACGFTNYGLATGSGTGLTISTTLLNGGVFYPTSDSTTAIQFDKADGSTNVLNLDTTNGRVGIGTTAPGALLDVNGATTATNSNNYSSGAINLTGNYWNGAASAADYWQMQNTFTSGTNPVSILKFIHTGSSGGSNISFYGDPSSVVQYIQSTSATSGANYSSPALGLNGRIWNGSASAQDTWYIQNIVGSGTNPTTTLNLGNHGGSTGASNINLAPGTGNVTLTQNSVVPFTSVGTGAVANTLYLNAGNVGIGTTSPTFGLQVNRSGSGGTFQCYDPTATTGSTSCVIQAGAADTGTTKSLNFLNNSGTSQGYINSVSGLGNLNWFGLGTATQSTGSVLDTSGRVYMASLTASAGLQTGVMCIGASSEVIQDSVACLSSGERYKKDIQPIPSAEALTFVLAARPVEFSYRPEFNGAFQSNPNYSGRQVGFIADQIQGVDPRLIEVTTAPSTFMGVSYPAGTPQTVRYQNMTAMLAGAIQQIQKEIDEMKAGRK